MAILQTQKVLTLDYWKKAGDIVPGDYVFDQKGNLVRVTLVQSYRANTCYEVVLDDHLTVAGDSHLKLLIESEKYRQRLAAYKGVHRFRRPLQQFSVDQILEKGFTGRGGRHLWSVPTTHPLNFPHQYLPIPPFVFAFWFFTEKKDGMLSPPAKYSEAAMEIFKDNGYLSEERYRLSTGARALKITPSIRKQLVPDVPRKIPYNYLLSSAEQRLELLRGIMMAKRHSYQEKKDYFSYYHKDLATITAIQFLAESLGNKTQVILMPHKPIYRLVFKSRVHLVPDQKPTKAIKLQYDRRFVIKINEIPAQNCVHIETENPETGFLVGEGFIACH